MKKEQLRESFARIQPREALVLATLEKIQEQRQRGESAQRKLSLGFMTRLAAATCALLLVIAVGVVAAKNDMIPSSVVVPSENERSTPMTADCQDPSGDAVISDCASELVGCEQMIETARAYGTDWAVFAATVDYLNIADGRVALRPLAIADKSESASDVAWTSEEQDDLMVCFDVSDAELCGLMINMGNVLVGIHAEERDGEVLWVLHEAYAQVEPIE